MDNNLGSRCGLALEGAGFADIGFADIGRKPLPSVCALPHRLRAADAYTLRTDQHIDFGERRLTVEQVAEQVAELVAELAGDHSRRPGLAGSRGAPSLAPIQPAFDLMAGLGPTLGSDRVAQRIPARLRPGGWQRVAGYRFWHQDAREPVDWRLLQLVAVMSLEQEPVAAPVGAMLFELMLLPAVRLVLMGQLVRRDALARPLGAQRVAEPPLAWAPRPGGTLCLNSQASAGTENRRPAPGSRAVIWARLWMACWSFQGSQRGFSLTWILLLCAGVREKRTGFGQVEHLEIARLDSVTNAV